MSSRQKGHPRPSSTYRGAIRNAEKKAKHDALRNARRHRWRQLGLAK